MPVDLRPRDGQHGPVCRNHGVICGMGRTWPAPKPEPTEQDTLLWDLIWQAREAKGQARPVPTFDWDTAPHIKVPRRELQARHDRHVELLAQAEQANAEKYARLVARHEEQRHAR